MTILAAVLGLLVAEQETIPLREYRTRLAAIAASLDRGEIDAVRGEAKALLGRRVRHAGAELPTDGTLLGPLATADLEAARKLQPRLEALRSALEAAETDSAAAAPDPDLALLERLRREEAVRDPRKGGHVARLPDAPPVPRTLAERIQDFFEWVWEKVTAFWKWLVRMFFPNRAAGGPSAGTPLWVAILVIALLVAIAAVALVALRRKRDGPRTAAAASAPAQSARDEDPLSRTAGEWERFAAELARAGRYREAIRAWYHAVLVSLFRAGVLHYRKDRTNWEYAYALAPQHGWRPEFLEATRRFELVWYGRRDIPEEAAGEYEQRARRILAVVRERAAE